MADPLASFPSLLTAQDLRQGCVVYWSRDGWTPRIDHGFVARDAAGAAVLEQAQREAASGDRVIDVYRQPAADAPTPAPVRLRDRARLADPLTRGTGAQHVPL